VLVLLLVGLFLIGTAGFVTSALNARPAGDPSPSPPASPVPAAEPEARGAGLVALVVPVSAARGATLDVRLAMASPGATPSPDAGTGAPGPGAVSPDPQGDPVAGLPSSADPPSVEAATTLVVPVTSFWSPRQSLTSVQVREALGSGRLKGFDRVVVHEPLHAPLADALGIDIPPSLAVGTVAEVERAAADRALGFIAVTDVAPRVRALGVDGRTLFGNARLARAGGWPLSVTLPADGDDPAGAWAQEATWVLVAGGDSYTDRGVYERVVRRGKGVDYPFAGGRARVTGHPCCDPVFGRNRIPRYELTGDRGVVRRLFKDADLAILNHESPITEAWDWHSSGTRFSGKPELTEIFTRAGIDWVSLANNHIKDYGTDAIADTRRILKRYGIRFGGAGVDLRQAREVDILRVGETRVAIVPCLDIAPAAWAGRATGGATPCKDDFMLKDLRAAKERADVVIAFPHWGVEYTRTPLASQRKKARRWVREGADLVLGAHSHVAGAMEDVRGRPVLYSMGNLIFDQHWATFTMEGVIVESTFHGDRLVQLRLHPHLIHDQSQPNLLNPAKDDGRKLLRQMRAASRDWLDW
jgi:poly-gamma-glutamate capsule biosynthesis protein CapA/YwtB (metallophosphatase superfamily)